MSFAHELSSAFIENVTTRYNNDAFVSVRRHSHIIWSQIVDRISKIVLVMMFRDGEHWSTATMPVIVVETLVRDVLQDILSESVLLPVVCQAVGNLITERCPLASNRHVTVGSDGAIHITMTLSGTALDRIVDVARRMRFAVRIIDELRGHLVYEDTYIKQFDVADGVIWSDYVIVANALCAAGFDAAAEREHGRLMVHHTPSVVEFVRRIESEAVAKRQKTASSSESQ